MRYTPLLLASLTLAVTAACGPLTVATPERPGQDLVVLLPDPGTGAVGRAVVSNTEGRVELAEARAAVLVNANEAPRPATPLSEEDVERLFGAVLAGLPPAPRHFTLYFRFESEELTDESRTLVQEVLRAVKSQPVPDVVAIGHTDTTGLAASNIELGLRRANTVRALLVEGGLDPASVDVTSHGEAELLVPTADGVFEPRNRRVDITVR